MNYKYIFHTFFGYAALLYSTDPFNITEIILPSPTRDDIIEKTTGYPECRISSQPEALLAARSIKNYFGGKIKFFPAVIKEWLNFENMTGLERKVLEKTASIQYGCTASYGDIARSVGRPEAYRFVGNTLAKNPFPVIIPCHRIIKSDGSCGGFGGGRDLKVRMLALEKRETPFL
jgi:methylated-DNA-[protein]-cysteine S-methyltransferase